MSDVKTRACPAAYATRSPDRAAGRRDFGMDAPQP
jgi:hypothetical protein